MSRGRRYNGEQKLNLKKVFAVVAVIIAIILFIVVIKNILKADKNTVTSKNIELNYFTLYTNGNWGVINSSGQTIIEPANSEMIEIPNKAKPVFICTYDVSTVDESFKTKAINEKNQQIFTDYDNIYTLQNYDENNNLWYEENILKVQKAGKYGIITIDGKETIPCEYDSITTLKGVENSIIIKKDSKVGLANSNGEIVVPVEYSDISAIGNDYRKGYIVKNPENKLGVIKADGKIALECKFDSIKNFADKNNYVVRENGSWKVLFEDGAAYLEGKVANAEDINNGDVIVNENGKYGVLNVQTDLKVPSEYEILRFMSGDKYIAKKDGKFGVINSNNEVVVEFKYADIIYNESPEYVKAKNENNTYDYMTKDLAVKFTGGEETVLNGFIKVQNGAEVKYYNYQLEEKSNRDAYAENTLFLIKENGKYGYVNRDGKVVVDAIYEDATEQNAYGYSAIKKDGKWGSIDQYGNVVVEPNYIMGNNSVIDFIGRWHVCADRNAGYYTDAE